jgi:hypothetical protein
MGNGPCITYKLLIKNVKVFGDMVILLLYLIFCFLGTQFLSV